VTDRIQNWLRTLALLWGSPTLPEGSSVHFDSRLRRSLGRCHPASGRIRLRADLAHAADDELREVLCHEAAHIVVYERFGASVRPHGPEWQHLVRQAGYAPQVRAPDPARMEVAARPPRPRYLHRCPVCQSVRVAGRPVRAWHCASCLDAGLPGELIITRDPGPKPQ
jgi:predicted SprT family Zn-dependent metalloprotease